MPTPEEIAAQAAAAAATAASAKPATPDFSALLHNGKIFGKYDTPEAAVKGFWELTNYAAEQARVAREAAGRAHTDPPARSALSRAAEEAIVKEDVFAAAIAEVAGRLVDARFKPIENTISARAQLMTEIPDYQKNESAVQGWLATNPEISNLVNTLQASGSPEGALAAQRLAYREWQASQVAASKPTSEQIAAAALPGGTGTAGPTGAAALAAQDDAKRLEEVLAYTRATGDKRPLFSELFKNLEFYPAPAEFTG